MAQTEPFKATIFIIIGMMALGLSDNYVRMISADAGLWQFHATRAAMAIPMIIIGSFLGLGALRPNRPWAVLGRSTLIALSMLIYFGCLAFLPIGVVVAGLFTAPIFVLLISVLFRGEQIGLVRWLAVAAGFIGALLVIQPAEGSLTALSFVPIIAGILYACGAVATRAWCEGEGTAALVLGFFGVLGLLGLLGLGVLAIWPQDVALGNDGFITRGAVPITGDFLFWTAVQAVGAIVGIGCLTKAYQIGEASFVAINEYSLIVFASFWAYVIWDETLGSLAIVGIVLIVASGAVITLRARR
ncbi:MAG: DMT family transporter [Octadecabacter sp.]|jgi:drug/metabolite transporter (DMT)-like permease